MRITIWFAVMLYATSVLHDASRGYEIWIAVGLTTMLLFCLIQDIKEIFA